MKKFKEAVKIAIAVRALRKNSDQDFNVRFHLVSVQLTKGELHVNNPHP